MTSPLVSVVCRTKDRPVFLARALRSIAGQTLADVIIILVNDGGDPEVVTRVLAQAPLNPARVVRIDHDSPLGRAGALIAGVARAETPYIAIHDDDDSWEPGFLERTSTYLTDHPEAGAVFVRTDVISEHLDGDQPVEDARFPVWSEITRLSLQRLAEENQGVPISVLYRADAIEAAGGFDPSLPVVEDWDLHFRLAVAGELGFIDSERPLAHWHHRSGLGGDCGNSTLALAEEHAHYDQLHRDQRLRAWLASGEDRDGLLLFLGARFGEERRRYEDLRARLERLERLERLDRLETLVEQTQETWTTAMADQQVWMRTIAAQTARLNRVLDLAATPVRAVRKLRRR